MYDLSLTVPNTQKGYFDEMVIFDDTNELYKYSFSKNIDDIEVAIYSRTGCEIELKKTTWKLNNDLSVKIRQIMVSQGLNYSMTTYIKNKRNHFVVNMRSGDLWFIAKFEEIHSSSKEKSNYYDSNIVWAMKYTLNSLRAISDEDDDSE